MTEWDWVIFAAGVVGLVAAIAFLGAYLYRSGLDAWRNPFGRYLIVRKTLLAGLFLTVILNRSDWGWWEDARHPATALLISAFALLTFWPYRLLLRAQEDAQLANEEAQRS